MSEFGPRGILKFTMAERVPYRSRVASDTDERADDATI
jgi:hypothetical protein